MAWLVVSVIMAVSDCALIMVVAVTGVTIAVAVVMVVTGYG